MEVPTILMSADKDKRVWRRAIENGATLFLQTPIFPNTMNYLWQFVMTEKIRRGWKDDEIRDGNCHCRERSTKIPEEHPSKKRRAGRISKNYEECLSVDTSSSCRVQKKNQMEWTDELHQKFMDAVSELGQGRCFPTPIMELMNVPGLTRMQVASHLQKCRQAENWGEEKPHSNNAPKSSKKRSRNYNVSFGVMPTMDIKVRKADDSKLQDNSLVTSSYSLRHPSTDSIKSPKSSMNLSSNCNVSLGVMPTVDNKARKADDSKFQDNRLVTSSYSQRHSSTDFFNVLPTDAYSQRPPSTDCLNGVTADEYRHRHPSNDFFNALTADEYRQRHPSTDFINALMTDEYSRTHPSTGLFNALTEDEGFRGNLYRPQLDF